MASNEAIVHCAESWFRMTKLAAAIRLGVAGRVVGAPKLRSPSIQGVKAPRTERAPNLGFPTVPKPPSRV